MLELIKGVEGKNDDFDIYLISLSDRIDYQYVFDLPIRFEVIRKKDKDLGLIFKLRKIIKRFDPDIIHFVDDVNRLPIAANVFLNKKLVNCVIYKCVQVMNSVSAITTKSGFLPLSPILAVTNSHAGMKAYKAPANKAVCIYNGIDSGKV